MKDILLDTHILLWWLDDYKKLPKKVLEWIIDGNNKVYYSIISIWEIELKNSVHPNSIKINIEEIVELCKESNIIQLPLKETHILQLKNLKRAENAPNHKDPFDRIMICQAIDENMIFITHDKLLPYYQSENIFMV